MTPAARHRQKKLARIAAAVAAEFERRTAQAAAAQSAPTPALAPSLIFPEASVLTRPGVSPAQRHRQAKLARLAVDGGNSGPVAPERASTGAEATEYDLLLAALGEDMARLRGIQSTEGKIAAKREMIDRYSHHVDASLAAAAASGTAVQDELLVTIMLWRLDIGDFDRGLDIAEHVLRHGLRLPDRFQRTPATLIAEEVAVAAIDAAGQDRDFALPVLQRTAALTDGQDMPDIVRAKLEKATGLHLLRSAEQADSSDSAPAGAPHAARRAALTHLRRALELEKSIGVKKQIERLSAWLNRHGPAEDTQD